MNTSNLSISKCFLIHCQFFLQSKLLSSRFFISEMGILSFKPLSTSLLLKFTDTIVERSDLMFLLQMLTDFFVHDNCFLREPVAVPNPVGDDRKE